MPIDLDNLSELKKLLSPLLDDCSFEEAQHGESNAQVLRVLFPGGNVAYLKHAAGAFCEEIGQEHERMDWLKHRVRVPKVILYVSSSERSVLLTEALRGRTADDASNTDPATIVAGMAKVLRELHSIPFQDCPFDESLTLRLRLASARVAAGLVDEDAFDLARQGMRARDVYEQLVAQMPESEPLVVTHGDACPENFIFDGDTFAGFVDCGRVGLADKYQDLALASRNIGVVFGQEFADRFFIEYGEKNPDLAKIEYYRMLDELF